MKICLTDLRHKGHEFRLNVQEWTGILHLLASRNIVERESLDRWISAGRVEIPVDVARKIGARLEEMFFDDIRAWMKPPGIPSYIVPIATSNGLWIDPALPLLNRRSVRDYSYLKFANFCQICSGFSIN